MDKIRLIFRLFLVKLINGCAYTSYLFKRKRQKIEITFLKTPTDNHKTSLCLFITYSNQLLPNHLRALEALYESGYEVIIVANKELRITEKQHKQLFGLIYNHNVGRDIGAYCRAMSHLYQTAPFLDHFNKILFLNDSVVFLSGLTEYFKKINASSHDWTGVTESTYRKYHVSSWCFQLSKKCLMEPKIIGFFQDFLPINSRHYLINQGEIEISQTLIFLSYPPRVIESVHDIVNYKGISIYYFPTTIMKKLIKQRLLNVTMDNRAFLAHAVLSEHSNIHNGTHMLNMNAILYNNFPFIKKDLRQREVHSLSELRQFVDELSQKEDAAIIDDILREVVYKIPLSDMPFFKRKLYAVGLI